MSKQDVIKATVTYQNSNRRRGWLNWKADMMGDTDRFHDPATRQRQGDEQAGYQELANQEFGTIQEARDAMICPTCGNRLITDSSLNLVCTNIHNHNTNHYIVIATRQELIDAGMIA